MMTDNMKKLINDFMDIGLDPDRISEGATLAEGLKDALMELDSYEERVETVTVIEKLIFGTVDAVVNYLRKEIKEGENETQKTES